MAIQSNFKNMVLTLLAVSLISATVLGFVHSLTKDAIEASKLKAQNDAIKAILPEFDHLGDSWKALPTDASDSLTFFPAYDGSNQLIAVAVKSYSNNGFSGLIEIMVGFKPEGDITGYQVLETKETPGLGSKAQDWFSNEAKPKQNIIGKNPGTTDMHVSKDGGDVDAITASTITSRAFLEAVRRAYDTFKNAAPTPATPEQPAAVTAEPVTEGGES